MIEMENLKKLINKSFEVNDLNSNEMITVEYNLADGGVASITVATFRRNVNKPLTLITGVAAPEPNPGQYECYRVLLATCDDEATRLNDVLDEYISKAKEEV